MKTFKPEELELHHRDCMLWVYDVVVGACRDSEIEVDIDDLKQNEWARWLDLLERGLNPWNPFEVADCDYGQHPELN